MTRRRRSFSTPAKRGRSRTCSGADLTVDHVAGLEHDLAGLAAVRLRLPAGSAFAGQKVRDTKIRTRTGVSIVAVVRDHDVHVPAEPGLSLEAADELVVVGSRDGISALVALLES